MYDKMREYQEVFVKYETRLDEDVASAIDHSHGKEDGWFDQVRKKSMGELTEEENQAMEEWIGEMRHRLHGKEKTAISKELDPKHSDMTPEEIASAEQQGQQLYASGDMAACRQQMVRKDVAYQRMQQVYGDLAEAIDKQGLIAAEGWAQSAQQVELAKQYLREKAVADAMVDAMDEAHKVEFDVAREKVRGMMVNSLQGTASQDGTGADGAARHASPSENPVVRILNDGKGNTYVIRNQNGDQLMVTDVLTDEQGNIRWDSYDENNAHVMRLDPSMAIGEMTEREVVEQMTPGYMAEDKAIFDGRDPEVGMQLESMTDSGQKNVSTIVGQDAQGNWILDTSGTQSVLDDATVRSMISENERTPIEAEYGERDAKLAQLMEELKPMAAPEEAAPQREWVADGKYKEGEAVKMAPAAETIGKMMQDADGDTALVVRSVRKKRERVMNELDKIRNQEEPESVAEAKKQKDTLQQLTEEKVYWDQVEQMMTGRDVRRYGSAPKGADKPESQNRELVERFAQEVGVDLLVANDFMTAYNEAITQWNEQHPGEEKPMISEKDANLTNGVYLPWLNRVLINSNTVRGLQFAFGHESGHSVAKTDAYQRFKGIVMKQMDQAWLENEVERKKRQDVYKGMSIDAITEEIVNDYIGRMMNDQEKMVNLLRAMGVDMPVEEQKSSIQALWDVTQKWLNDMTTQNWDELMAQAKASGQDAVDRLLHRKEMSEELVGGLNKAERLLAEAYEEAGSQGMPRRVRLVWHSRRRMRSWIEDVKVDSAT